MGFGCRPPRTSPHAPGPASESRQGTKPREMEHPNAPRALTTINSEIALRRQVFQARAKAAEAYWRQRIADLKAQTASAAAERRAALEARIAALQLEAEAAKAR